VRFGLGPRQTAGAIGFVALVVVLADIGGALAQATRTPATRTGECAQLPGGRAPVLKIATLTSGLSPRDLDLVYFGKPLAELTDEDFTQIADLSKRCGAGEGILPEDKQQAFQAIVRDAQQLRRASLDKIQRQMTDIQHLPVARDKLTRLNGLSENLPLLEPTMTRGDIKYAADWIARQMQAVYDSTPKGEATRPPAPPPRLQAATSAVDARAGAGRQPVPGREED